MTILKVRLGTRRTRLVEVARRDSSGGGIGWRVNAEGKRLVPGELILFAARNIACEMQSRPHDELMERAG